MAPIDNESSGEDFDMREVDVMQYTNQETKELGNIAESGARYTTPDISPDLLPLWKKFTAKLPLECMMWLKEQLQTQFEVFRGWAGLTGLISADVEPFSHFVMTGGILLKPLQLDIEDTPLPVNEKAANDGPKVAEDRDVVGNARQVAECLKAADNIAEDSNTSGYHYL